MSIKNISTIISFLRTYYRAFKIPSVTAVSNHYRNPFFVLVSCIISLRTKDAVTHEASQRLFRLAKNPTAMSALTPRSIEKAIYPAGFYHVKARVIKNLSRDIIERFGGKVPDTLEGLLSLKGVGRKTANLVLTLGFGKLGICVDTHVHRISNRLGFVKTKNPFETEMKLRELLPTRYWIEYNDLLVTFGQNICKPTSPLCSTCRLNSLCPKIGVRRHR